MKEGYKDLMTSQGSARKVERTRDIESGQKLSGIPSASTTSCPVLDRVSPVYPTSPPKSLKTQLNPLPIQRGDSEGEVTCTEPPNSLPTELGMNQACTPGSPSPQPQSPRGWWECWECGQCLGKTGAELLFVNQRMLQKPQGCAC